MNSLTQINTNDFVKTEEEITQELEDKMRLFVNMIIDRVLEDRKQGIIRY